MAPFVQQQLNNITQQLNNIAQQLNNNTQQLNNNTQQMNNIGQQLDQMNAGIYNAQIRARNLRYPTNPLRPLQKYASLSFLTHL